MFKAILKKHHFKDASPGLTNCPIAQMLKEKFPGLRIYVGTSNVNIGGLRVPLPYKAQQVISRYDGGPVTKYEWEKEEYWPLRTPQIITFA